MKKLYCYNRWAFEDMCKKNGWNDKNLPADAAFISICGTKDCQEYVIKEREFHYFEEKHDNVFNAVFDDITEYRQPIPEEVGKYRKGYCYGLDTKQALDIVEFIRKNLGKDFYIHCRAGHSRSQAVVRYILDMYDGIVCDFSTRLENPPISWNQFVLAELKNAAFFTGEKMRMDLLRSGIKSRTVCFGEHKLSLLIDDLNTTITQDESGMWVIGSPDRNKPYYDEFEIIPELQKLIESQKP